MSEYIFPEGAEIDEPKIGEVYYYEGTPLKVVEGRGCEGCFFDAENDYEECASDGRFEHCHPDSREDGKYVKFIELETTDNPYATLTIVLEDAYDQARLGKGKERHAADNNFEDQVMCQVQRLLKDHPFGGLAYQVIKKTIEAGRLYQIKGPEEAYREILGAINYLGGMGHLIKNS